MTDVERWCPQRLWDAASVLIPPPPIRPQGGGRRRGDDRPILAVILYVLQTGCSWWALPTSFGVSRATAHRRFTEWTNVGLFTRLHLAMLDQLGRAGRIDWTRVHIDAQYVRAEKGGT